MDVFADYLAGLDHPLHRARMEEVLSWVPQRFPDLVQKVAWNQPMYTDHGTFIIGFSAAKEHFAVSPERAGMIRFADEIAEAGYDSTKQLIRIRWEQPVDYALLERMIAFNREDKADCATFWRK